MQELIAEKAQPSEYGWQDLATPRPMRCGWVSPSGEHWGAIWMYKNYIDFNQSEFFEPTQQSMTFEFDEDDFDPPSGYDVVDMKAQAYRFADLDSYADVALPTVGTPIPGSLSGGVMSYTIPNVDHNPIFLRFHQ